MAASDPTDACPGCDGALSAVRINTEERVVTMRSCSRCDRRWWTADGEVVDPVELFAVR